MFRTGILSSGSPGRFHKGASLALFAAALFLFGAIASAQSKETMHARMVDLARQMDAMKPSLASNPVNAYAWSQLMDEYRALSQAMGGDDPAKAMPGLAAARSAPTGGGPADAEGCGSINVAYTNTTDTAIPTGPAVVSSQIIVADAGNYIYDLDLRTLITHTFAADLDITLTSPAGTVVTLTSDNGAGTDNVFNGTIWDDQANLGGQVPYTTNDGLATDHAYVNLTLASPLVPEEAMTAFRGENPNGTWTLTISDDLAGDGGILDEWSLLFRNLPGVAGGQGLSLTQGVPTPIPTGPAVVTSTLNFPVAATVCGVNITTSLDHTFAADLDITLMSPSGTVSTMTTDNGSGNDNVFSGTLWNDDANPGGQVPYVSNDGLVTDQVYVNLTTATPLVPEEAGGAFLGEQASGTWTITISDDLAGDGGTLNSWNLNIRACGCVQSVFPRRADVHASGGASNLNGVAEPGEQFVFESKIRNSGAGFGQNFDTQFVPALPLPWTETLQVGLAADAPWRTSNVASFSSPNAAFAPDPSHITDNYLDTPAIVVNQAGFFLDFMHSMNMEDTYDGGVIEISIGGGPFQDIIAAGGAFFVNGYTDTIDNGFSSPIAGRQAFSGNSGGFLRTIVILPNAAIGQSCVFRFRAATDTSVAGTGWRIDNVALGGLINATVAGQAFGFGGPAGGTYTVNDNNADYGVIEPAGANNCFDETGNCYEFTVGGSRPDIHWDANLLELTSTGLAFNIPIHMGGSFADVPGGPYYRFVETLLHFGVTSGCGGPAYCPSFSVLREQMAVFLLISKFGSSYTPPPCGAPMFNDVPCSSPYAPFINELVVQGITSGCGGGNFCPTSAVLREQMAVFLLVALEGAGYLPPACSTPLFTDVPCSSPYSRFVNELYRRGITGGCGGSNYCPSDSVTREQMAVFLSVTFTMHLY